MIKLFLQLLRRDFLILRQELWTKIINVSFWLGPNIVIFNYVLPGMGIDQSYGVFILVGGIATVGLFTAVSSIPELLNDIEDNHSIYYYLSLPSYQWLTLARYAVAFAMSAFMVAFTLLPICKLVLWNLLDFSNFSLLKYLLIFPLLQIFFGFFALLITAYTSSIVQYEKAWVRIVFPLWFFGGYQFPWSVMRARLPYLAYANLLNPITYCLEGFRGAVLGQAGFINFWVCFGMLLLSTVVVAIWGVRKLLHRLDCIN
jgi:ABC-type multidrug transport system permease subunit